VGRDAELAWLDSFIRGASSGAALVLIGGPGIAKATLWEAAIGLARAEASDDLELLAARLDSARGLFALGHAQRRATQWRAARETLERASAAFRGLGADGWQRRAASELARVGGRRRADGELTPSERRVVELCISGTIEQGDRLAASP
jgi:hypothetical protein